MTRLYDSALRGIGDLSREAIDELGGELVKETRGEDGTELAKEAIEEVRMDLDAVMGPPTVTGYRDGWLSLTVMV
jgi:hypothetical protein